MTHKIINQRLDPYFFDKVGFSSSQYDLEKFLDKKEVHQQYLLFMEVINKVQPDIVIYRPDRSINVLTTSLLETKKSINSN